MISQEIEIIKNQLNKFAFNFNHYIRIKTVIDQLSSNLQIIIQLLTDLENSIAFSKLETVHSTIINTKDLNNMLSDLEKFYPNNQLLRLNNTNEYYKLLRISSYYSKESIVFIIHFPIYHTNDFKYYNLYPLPNQNSQTIIPPKPFLVTSNSYHQYMNEKCMKIENTWACKQEHLLPNEKEDCISNILLNKQTNCEYTRIHYTKTIVEKINEALYIIITTQNERLQLNCNKQEILEIIGTHLIELPITCSFTINNERYSNREHNLKEQPLQLPGVTIRKENTKISNSTFNIEKIELKNLHLLKEEQKTIDKISYEEPKLNIHHNIWLPVIYIIITILIIYMVYKCKQRKQPEKSVEVNLELHGPPEGSSKDGRNNIPMF